MKQVFNISKITNKRDYIMSLLESKIGTDVLFLTVLPNKDSLCYDYPYISISKGNRSVCNRYSLFRRLSFFKEQNTEQDIILNDMRNISKQTLEHAISSNEFTRGFLAIVLGCKNFFSLSELYSFKDFSFIDDQETEIIFSDPDFDYLYWNNKNSNNDRNEI